MTTRHVRPAAMSDTLASSASAVALGSPDSGSSSTKMRASRTSSRASITRRCSPPERLGGTARNSVARLRPPAPSTKSCSATTHRRGERVVGGRGLQAERQVLREAALEQARGLREHTELRQRLGRELAQRHTAHRDAAFVRLVQAQEQPQKRGFSATRGPGDAHDRAVGDGEREAVEDGLRAPLRREAHTFEHQRRVFELRERDRLRARLGRSGEREQRERRVGIPRRRRSSNPIRMPSRPSKRAISSGTYSNSLATWPASGVASPRRSASKITRGDMAERAYF